MGLKWADIAFSPTGTAVPTLRAVLLVAATGDSCTVIPDGTSSPKLYYDRTRFPRETRASIA
eukprot:1958102-Rhodomonas_salina.4